MILFLTTLLMTFTQERPDFSGTWNAQSTPQVWGQQFSIDHRGESLNLLRTIAGVPAAFSYVLDGSETTSRMPGRLCTADSGATWTASWNANAVVITMIGALPPNGKPVKMDVKSTLQMESPDA